MDSIGVCVVGNFQIENQYFTEECNDSLISLLIYLCNKYNISPDNIQGNGDWGATECPGKYLYERLPGIRDLVKNYLNHSIINDYTYTEKYLNLQPHMQSWAVYNENGPYTLQYKIGSLLPSYFGGLSYRIIQEKDGDVYIIKTNSYGICAIWAPKDNDSSITSYPIYINK